MACAQVGLVQLWSYPFSAQVLTFMTSSSYFMYPSYKLIHRATPVNVSIRQHQKHSRTSQLSTLLPHVSGRHRSATVVVLQFHETGGGAALFCSSVIASEFQLFCRYLRYPCQYSILCGIRAYIFYPFVLRERANNHLSVTPLEISGKILQECSKQNTAACSIL